jgi:hypothetical protein
MQSEWTRIAIAAAVAVIAMSFLAADALLDVSSTGGFARRLEAAQASFIGPR